MEIYLLNYIYSKTAIHIVIIPKRPHYVICLVPTLKGPKYTYLRVLDQKLILCVMNVVCTQICLLDNIYTVPAQKRVKYSIHIMPAKNLLLIGEYPKSSIYGGFISILLKYAIFVLTRSVKNLPFTQCLP